MGSRWDKIRPLISKKKKKKNHPHLTLGFVFKCRSVVKKKFN